MKTRRSLFFFRCAVLGVCAVEVMATSGCQTEPAHKTTEVKPASVPVLVQGMTTDEIIARVGRPVRIRKMESELPAEVWIYERSLGAVSTMNAATTSTGAAMNPVTGEITTTPELNYRMERVAAEQHSELLIVEGKLVSSKQYVTQSSTLE